MPTEQIALIRGINVGRAKRVAMADLREMVESLGYENARTILNSGNVVFAVPKGAAKPTPAALQKAMEKALGVSAAYTLLTAKELSVVLDENPLLEQADNHSRLLVSVPDQKARLGQLEPLSRQDWGPEALALGSRAAYAWAPAGVLESPLMKAVAKVLGDGVTTRNWATMLKIAAKLK